MQLTQPIHKAARERPNDTATVFGDRRKTFAEHQHRIAKLAGALQTLGAKPNDRIAMLALNADYYVEYVFATLWAGAVINPVNTRWSLAEIAYSLVDCDTGILLVDDAFAKLVEPLRAQCPCIRHVIYCGSGTADGTLNAHHYEALIESSEPVADACRSGTDLAAILYTGGTTGQSKGVMLSHAALYINSLSVLAVTRPQVDTFLHVAPMFHVGGLVSIFQSSLRLSTQIILSGFDPLALIQSIEREQVNETFLVPTMIQLLIDHPEFANHDVSSLRNIVYGAAPIDETLLQRALHALPNSEFMQVYGMTEIAPVVAILPNSCHTIEGQSLKKLKAAGRPTSINEVKIINPSTGEESPTGEFGEITVRGPSLMLGYWNKPEETARALHHGWMYTGDGGYMDEDGYLYVTDRLKDMIVSGGENDYSCEVENAILTNPAVQLCAVIGIPDQKWGEAVHAVVVVREGHRLSEDQVKETCRGLIAGYKTPRSVEFRTELPLSAAGKLLKYKLRDAIRNTESSSNSSSI